MDIVADINDQDWLQAAGTRAVMQALHAREGDGKGQGPWALFVGGCVRNALLGRAVTDIDIATVLTPEAVMAALEAAGIKAVPTGLDHGTVTAVTADGCSYEITTLRRDVETDGRHARVAYTDDWAEDAARRDFTMNTLLADSAGRVYDPTGQGLADLKARKIVFVGDPARRIEEDYLRILRFFRFHAQYGVGDPDPAALAACRAAAGRIKDLSRERVTQEFLKLLSVHDPAPTLESMIAHDVMADPPGGDYDPAALARLCALQAENDAFSIDTRLFLLAADQSSLDRYLVLTKAQEKQQMVFAQILSTITAADEKTIKILIYHYGNESALQGVLLHAARDNGALASDITWMKSWQAPVLPVTGDDVLKAGVVPGPVVGEILGKVEAFWLAQDMQPDRAACLEKIATLIRV